jgi:hypothetical protein
MSNRVITIARAWPGILLLVLEEISRRRCRQRKIKAGADVQIYTGLTASVWSAACADSIKRYSNNWSVHPPGQKWGEKQRFSLEKRA